MQPLQLVNGNGPAEEADPSDEFFRDLLASLPSGGNAAHAPDSSPDSRRFGESKAASISTPNSSSATPQFSSPRAPTPAAVSNPLSALQDLQARFQTESSTMPPRASGSDAKSRSTRSEASAEELRNQSGLSVELIGDLDVEESAILRKGIDLYFNTAAYFAPVLGARQSFVSHVNLRPSLLLHAVATLGWRLASGNDLSARERADSALAIARELADEAIMAHAVSAASEAGESLYIIQALILLTYSEYGLGELARAGASARAAVRLAIEYGLHRVDATPPAFSSLSEHEPTSSAQPQASFSSRTRLLEGICARAETSHDLREALRRAWWEVSSAGLIYNPKQLAYSLGYDSRRCSFLCWTSCYTSLLLARFHVVLGLHYLILRSTSHSTRLSMMAQWLRLPVRILGEEIPAIPMKVL